MSNKLTCACWNLVSISPRIHSNASCDNLNSSATRLEHKVDLKRNPNVKHVAPPTWLVPQKSAPQVGVKEKCGVALRLFAQPVFSRHDDKSLAQITHAFDDSNRVECGRTAQVDMENLLRVPDQAAQVYRQHDLTKQFC